MKLELTKLCDSLQSPNLTGQGNSQSNPMEQIVCEAERASTIFIGSQTLHLFLHRHKCLTEIGGCWQRGAPEFGFGGKAGTILARLSAAVAAVATKSRGRMDAGDV